MALKKKQNGKNIDHKRTVKAELALNSLPAVLNSGQIADASNSSVSISQLNQSQPWWQKKLYQLFGADIRSLALLRVGVGALLLGDLINRSKDLVAHYTDFGVLPRQALLELASNPWHFTFHTISGAWQVQALLFIIAGIFSVSLILGYKTRLSTIVSFILLISLQNRNPVILHNSDTLIRVTLFWCLFLPWGKYFSVDSALRPHQHQPNPDSQTLSMATAGYLTQMMLLYIFTAMFKSGPDWHANGTAIYYALSDEAFTRNLGYVLLHYPTLMTWTTHTVLWFETIGPWLLIIPFGTTFFRSAAVLGFVGLHTGIGLTMHLGMFPWTSAIVTLGLLPTGFWDWLRQVRERWRHWRQHHGYKTSGQLTIYYDSECGFCQNAAYIIKTFLLLDKVEIKSAQAYPKILKLMLDNNSWVIEHSGHGDWRNGADGQRSGNGDWGNGDPRSGNGDSRSGNELRNGDGDWRNGDDGRRNGDGPDNDRFVQNFNNLQNHKNLPTSGNLHIKFDGFLTLLAAAPLFWPLKYLFDNPLVRPIGRLIYEYVASHRIVACSLEPPQRPRTHKDHLWWFITNALAGFFILYILMWNLSTLPASTHSFYHSSYHFPPRLAWIGQLMRLDQMWNMFSPTPPHEDGWYVIPGQLADGRSVDVFRGTILHDPLAVSVPPDFTKPVLVSSSYPDYRWQKYLMNMANSGYQSYRLYFGRYLCRAWNSEHGGANSIADRNNNAGANYNASASYSPGSDTLENFEIYYVQEWTQPPGQGKPDAQPVSLWRHECF